MDHLSVDIYIYPSTCLFTPGTLGVGVPLGGRPRGWLGGGAPEGTPEGPSRDFTIFQTTKSHEKTEMSLSFSQLGHFLYGVLVVHGPPPYKNCPPQHFLATFTAVCIFTSQMGSVGLCRDEDNSSQHLPCQADRLSGSDGCCLVPHLSAGGDHPPQRWSLGPSNA
jgi:hypothetical protein